MAEVVNAAPPPEETTDTTVLLRMLNDELERLKESDKHQREDIDKKDRDVQRTTVMLSLSQQQLELGKERNLTLKNQLDAEREQIRELESKLQKVQHDLSLAKDDTSAATKRGERIEGNLKADLEGAKITIEQLEGTVTRLREELETTRVAFAAKTDEAEKQSREAYQTKVTLQTRLDTVTTELDDLQQIRATETKEVTSREYELSRTITTLKKELKETKENAERENKSAFELQTLLKTESESLKLKLVKLEGMTKASDRENFETITRLNKELQESKDIAESAREAAIAREKAQDQQIAKLVSDLKAAQAEVNELAEREATGAKTHIDTIVQLSATRDALRLRVASLEEDNEKEKGKLRAAETEQQRERDEMKRKLHLLTKDHDAALAGKGDRISQLTHELSTTTYRMTALEEELATTKKAAEQQNKIQAAEIGSLKAEVEGYRKSVEMLERDLNDNLSLRTMKEQNDSLKNQIVTLRNQVSHANTSLANLRIEADISESYRIKQMQEHVEAQLSRVSALEKERRFARPLLQDLVELTNRHELADPGLARDIDLFLRQFGNISEAAPSVPVIDK